jgi:acetolactate synthase-1/2/3 large subunit
MKTSDAIWQVIAQYTDTVFFVPGGGAAFLVDALGRSGLKRVSALHEQGAGFMAIGYAEARGGLGVCLVTSGPGATNAVTPCAAAWMDSIPVLFISGQSNLNPNERLRVRGVQAVDIISMVQPITKAARQPEHGQEALGILNSMIWNCTNGRAGPCWLDVPLAVQAEERSYEPTSHPPR